MEGFNVQMDCIIEGDVHMLQYKSSSVRSMQREFASLGFEGRYKSIGQDDMSALGRNSFGHNFNKLFKTSSNIVTGEELFKNLRTHKKCKIVRTEFYLLMS